MLKIEINNIFFAIAAFFFAVNFIAFFLMLWDKSESGVNNAERISEGMLFFMAVAFGSLGVYAGMYAFRHKTRKWYFVIGIPLVVLENIAFLYLGYVFLSANFIIQ